MYHDLGREFLSPTINLFMDAPDFVRFCAEYRRCLNTPLRDAGVHPIEGYPMATLGGGVSLHLVHYANFEEAREKWEIRAGKVLPDEDRIFFIMNDRNNCTENDLRAFANLPYRHKALLVHRPRKDIECSYYIKGYEQETEVGIMTAYAGLVKRNYDQFDWVEFLNGCQVSF